MAFGRQKIVEPTRGEGSVSWAGQSVSGAYEITGDPLQLRARDRLRMVFETTPESAEAIFRTREARIEIDGRAYRLEALAHTAGQGRVWSEIMVG